jgi:hypothetical protein
VSASTAVMRKPSQLSRAPGAQCVKSAEEQQPLLHMRKNGRDRTISDLLPLLWLECVHDIGVAAGDGAEFIWMGASPQAMRQRGSLKAQRKGSQKRHTTGWMHVRKECAALNLLDGLRIDKLPRGRDQRRAIQRLRPPGAGKAAVPLWLGLRHQSNYNLQRMGAERAGQCIGNGCGHAADECGLQRAPYSTSAGQSSLDGSKDKERNERNEHRRV